MSVTYPRVRTKTPFFEMYKLQPLSSQPGVWRKREKVAEIRATKNTATTHCCGRVGSVLWQRYGEPSRAEPSLHDDTQREVNGWMDAA